MAKETGPISVQTELKDSLSHIVLKKLQVEPYAYFFISRPPSGRIAFPKKQLLRSSSYMCLQSPCLSI